MPADPAVAVRRWRHAVMMARLFIPYAVFATLKHIVPLPRLARWAWLRPVASRDLDAEASAIRCAVRLRNWLGGDRGDCLHGSLALYSVLSRAGADPRLVVGVKRDAGAVSGHVWVVVNGATVAEAPPTSREFTPAFEFGQRGQIVALPPAPSHGRSPQAP
jgi:Transglutaminase-like superfamily